MSRYQKDICILEWNCDKMKPSSVVQSKRHDQLTDTLIFFSKRCSVQANSF